MIQRCKLSKADFGGEPLEGHRKDLKRNNDLLQLTRPDVIREIHEQYLEAGAGLVETNAFGATSAAQDAHHEQASGVLEDDCDLFLVETIFDTLSAKAAIFALDELIEATGERLPVIVCGSVTDASGRIFSSQTVSAFWHSVRHAKPLAVGLNGALGATLMRPYIEALTCVAGSTFVSCYPNAGLPNPMSETGFDETPEIAVSLLAEFAKAGFLNIAGGCCDTTPAQIAAIAQKVGKHRPRCGHNGAWFGALAPEAT